MKNGRGRPRKLAYGVGVNDADYKVVTTINGKRVMCPFYRKWRGMLQRCCSERYKLNRPAYVECFVCDEWLTFSAFKGWMIEQDWRNKELDKDIVNPGNKIYSPDNCCFVDKGLNDLLIDRPSNRGRYPKGVSLSVRDGVFCAHIRIKGKTKAIGRFDNPISASKVYVKEKTKLITSEIEKQTDERIINGLKLHIKLLQEQNQ